MHRWVIEDLVLGQPVPTTSASARRQLCGTVTYSRSRPKAVASKRKFNARLQPFKTREAGPPVKYLARG